jgi:hypothetical protein
MPPPTDRWGRSEWDLLGSEQQSGHQWDQWENTLRAFVHSYWSKYVAGIGFTDVHVVIRRAGVVDVSLQHGSKACPFADQAAHFLYTINSNPVLRFPNASQVEEIHLEIKMGRSKQ